MRIAIVGSGYVGLVAAACLAELGHEVVCVDSDRTRIAALGRGEVPIHEEYLPELLKRHRGRGLAFTDDLPRAVRASSVVFIAVGTPTASTGETDLSYVEAVVREVAGEIDSSFKLVVEKSTVPVHTANWIRRIMLLNQAPHDGFAVAANPEFLREGSAVADFLYPDRIVIGSEEERATEILREVYEPLLSGRYAASPGAVPPPRQVRIPAPLLVTSTKSAEVIKHASNAFLAMKVSFVNAIANLCELVDADIVDVARGVGADSRIGEKFLRAGIGFGGSCFPKDVTAFRTLARDKGYEFRLLDEVARINREQQQRFLEKIRGALWTLKGKQIAALGLAYKGGTDDIRESPALSIIRALVQEKCRVTAYDPAAMERAREVLPVEVRFAPDPYAAAAGADAAIILTDWKEFARLDLERLRQELRYPILIDGRNLYRPSHVAACGLTYVSVGRPEVGPDDILRNRGEKTPQKLVSDPDPNP